MSTLRQNLSKKIFTNQWAQLLDFLSKPSFDMAELEKEKIRIKRDFFNRVIADYKTQYNKVIFKGQNPEQIDIPKAMKNRRTFKIEMAKHLMAQLDRPLTNKQSLSDLIEFVNQMAELNSKVDSSKEGGRLGAHLKYLSQNLQSLSAKISKVQEPEVFYGHELVTAKEVDEKAYNNDTFDYSHIEGLYYAMTYHQIGNMDDEKQRNPEKEIMNRMRASTSIYLALDQNTVEKELVACEKISTHKKISAHLERAQENNAAQIQLEICKEFFIKHALSQCRQRVAAYFAGQLHKFENEAQEWFVNQTFGKNRKMSILEHPKGLKSFEDSLEKILIEYKLKPHDSKHADIAADLNFAISKFIENLQNFFDWPRSVSRSDANVDNDNKHYVEILRAFENDFTIVVNLFKSNLQDASEYLSSSDAAINEKISQGEAAANKLLKAVPFSAEALNFESKKQKGLVASAVLESKILVTNYLKNKNQMNLQSIDQKDEKEMSVSSPKSIAMRSMSLFAPPKISYTAEVLKMRSNIQQIVDFYMAKHKGKGQHQAVIEKFKILLKSNSENIQDYKNELFSFWNSQVKRYKNEISLVNAINSKNGHHLQRMVGLLLQDRNEIGNFIKPYAGYHQDYCLDIVEPKQGHKAVAGPSK